MDSHNTIYSGNRPDLIKYIPDNAKRILDVGCGEGGLGKLLIDSGRWELSAIELNAEAAKKAEPYYNKVIVGDVQSIIFPYPKNYFDCIVCGDVLEHLYDPWITLEKLTDYLEVNGDIIISLPNIRHYKVLKKLVIGGRWEYKASGILDRSHIRFFTLIEMEIMLQNAGLRVKYMQRVIRGRSYMRFLNKLLFGLLDDILTEQYIFAAGRT